MSIAIVLGTHGSAAGQLLKTSEMIVGKQYNIICIDFFFGENTEILFNKYVDCLKDLNIKQGVLFLVDTWGGSPFNASSQIAIDKTNYEVVTGINIPMLIEVFMGRDENLSFKEIIKIAVNTGRSGIRALKMKENIIDYDISIVKNSIIADHINTKSSNKEKHMIIGLSRIDDRLIHGQVVTCWTKETNICRIIVVSDEVASDSIRKTLLTQVAPPGITAHVLNIDKAIRVYNNPKYINDRVMFLFTNPTDVLRLVEKGVIITSVNIGGMAFHIGKTQISNSISVDKKDIQAFKKLHQHGIELEVRKVPSDSPLKMMDLIKKIDT